ncbi:hypothetical protein BRC63_10230 [Halobacteriales archaeon QH_10_70_21]|nr:MAG: hypothetical protein BRC63_10230 [Halobacteriales archaeon QH_10_70_21]
MAGLPRQGIKLRGCSGGPSRGPAVASGGPRSARRRCTRRPPSARRCPRSRSPPASTGRCSRGRTVRPAISPGVPEPSVWTVSTPRCAGATPAPRPAGR